MADSSGTTLMDLITSDPAASKPGGAAGNKAPSPGRAAQPTALGKPATDRKSKKATLLQIQNDTISAAKAVRTNIMPHRSKKKPVSYAQLARSIHELAATSDQKKSQKQLINHVFPKLAVYNSVDPSLAPSLLMLHQQCEDRTILRYVYYYLARILSDTGSQGLSSGGGIPTPNWDALADIDAVGGVTRADVVPRIVSQLTAEAKLADVEYHPRRLQALKALTYAPSSNSEILSNLYEIVFSILEQVGDAQKRKKGMFGTKGGDKEVTLALMGYYSAYLHSLFWDKRLLQLFYEVRNMRGVVSEGNDNGYMLGTVSVTIITEKQLHVRQRMCPFVFVSGGVSSCKAEKQLHVRQRAKIPSLAFR